MSFPLNVEGSNPTASAIPARPPDSNGWYNHPVAVSFGGSSFSGIASCSPPVTYSGATVSGSCTDNAGKTASAPVSFKYDATPPTITGATPSRPPDLNGFYTHAVSFSFNGTDPVSGIASCQTMTYSGPGRGSVSGGCWDKAGNYASTTVSVPYLQQVTQAKARIASAPTLLHWKAKPHASYYNVQIYRGSTKVLSTWPTKTSLLLSRSWKFRGRKFHLKAGTYHWYVWPGYGSRAADHYGRMIVSKSFTVS